MGISLEKSPGRVGPELHPGKVAVAMPGIHPEEFLRLARIQLEFEVIDVIFG
jgi:hypothetical protein